MNLKENYMIIFIGIAIISVSFVTVVYEMSESHKHTIIDPQSEYGKELTAIAEKAIEEECIDTSFLSSGNLVQSSSGTITLTFSGARSYSSGVIYSHADLGVDETVTFFAADLDRYDLRIQTSKKGVTLSEIYGYGKDYNYTINDNSIELINPTTNKVMFVLSDYTVVQDENKTDTIADEINSKYAYAQQPLPINKENPYIIVDVTGNDREGGLTIETSFYKGELYSMHIQESTKQGLHTTTMSHGIRYYDENGEVITEPI